jgi:hypothetical protein
MPERLNHATDLDRERVEREALALFLEAATSMEAIPADITAVRSIPLGPVLIEFERLPDRRTWPVPSARLHRLAVWCGKTTSLQVRAPARCCVGVGSTRTGQFDLPEVLDRQNRCIAGDDDLPEVLARFERLVGLNGSIQRVHRSDVRF